MTKVEILGVKIDNLSLQEILEKVSQFLESKNQHFIVTPNPEFLVAAEKDKNFKEILNYADIVCADGIGLIYAAKFLGKILWRTTGVDLLWAICHLAEQKNCSIYFLGAAEGVAEKTVAVLKKYFPHLIIAGAQSGGLIADPKQIESRLIYEISKTKPKIIFVALGQVKQEKWIFYHLDKLPSVKVAIGVGGAFDYLAGEVNRAPEIIRTLGLEWLYRLINQPGRLKRVINAVVIFPFLIIKSKIFPKNID
ncbi:MAG: hypothetical protein A2729_02180 [Candidatus Buchananbacteria bacterium RIFCSPHIGHO2_01_FULL_39_14]|uniref:Uncharacterized protein n=1 Tax=Candidatus Buchananbacteria bacterium RIFCSPHIGHO2_01_FULL_39_14 TaxID=1797532 RepID=A0A1G1XWK2_9BACT|nr:MAG: hypothetical protein A2729_02180 [Candidatus Buchananbacteria bacterium RIFCSPHIGHO2_01_FULL_39_14]OGY48217.1 MAG: hypothetical protein A3D39_03785 [Candidatus Buchananbacteria bacterium RIFCSPHIGHO2_02_FULL_39_17]